MNSLNNKIFTLKNTLNEKKLLWRKTKTIKGKKEIKDDITYIEDRIQGLEQEKLMNFYNDEPNIKENICTNCNIEMDLNNVNQYICPTCNLINSNNNNIFDDSNMSKPPIYKGEKHFKENLDFILGNKTTNKITQKDKNTIKEYITRCRYDLKTMNFDDINNCLSTLKLTKYNRYKSQILNELCGVSYPTMSQKVYDDLLNTYTFILHKINTIQIKNRKNSYICSSVALRILRILARFKNDDSYMDYLYLFPDRKTEKNNIELDQIIDFIEKDIKENIANTTDYIK